ncbi:MAG: ATP-dependent DNA helicase [bacterium]
MADAQPGRKLAPAMTPATCAAVFGPGGRLTGTIEDCEHRPQQQAMAEAVEAAFAGQGRLAVEAGTGVGKSLAYLVPAAAWAARTGSRVAVSTYTRILQDQLLTRDVRLLRRLLPDAPRVEVAYGQENYLCRLRLHARVNHGLFDTREQAEAADELLEWAADTETGILLEAPVTLPAKLQRRVGRDSAACPRQRCPSFGECHWYRARRAWEAAGILVVNHALYFAGSGEGGVLPEIAAVVFDEAHRLEDAAVSHFGVRLNQHWLTGILDNLFPASGRGLLQSLPRSGIAPPLEAATLNCRAELAAFFSRLQPDPAAEPGRRKLADPVEAGPAPALEKLGAALARAAADLGDEELGVELGGAGRWLGEAAAGLRRFEEPDTESSVRWLEWGQPGVTLNLAPLSVAEQLAAEIYSKLRVAVLTSATLTVANNFEFTSRRLGLEGFTTLQLDSPFDHGRNSLLYVPDRLPLPTDPAFTEQAARQVSAITRASRGRALVLFTSYEMMRRVHEACDDNGHARLIQGELPLPQLLERFRTDIDSVLFATQSFWQGVDIPGESLSCLIICRLPFEVPDDPRLTAIADRLRADGIKPFTAYQLPTAVLRFRQGFGRLIRSRRDRGVVCVLDRRILTKGYGDTFLRSLPPGIRLTTSLADIERFFAAS